MKRKVVLSDQSADEIIALSPYKANEAFNPEKIVCLAEFAVERLDSKWNRDAIFVWNSSTGIVAVISNGTLYVAKLLYTGRVTQDC